MKHGALALVDEDNYELINGVKWYLDKDGYAISPPLRMHRVIMEAESGEEVDHINGNKLDNRKENLRICSNLQNSWNKGKMKKGENKYKGVSWHKTANKWYVRIFVEGKSMNKGLFTDETAGANAYNYYAKEYFGEFANLNDVSYMPKSEWEKYRPVKKTSSLYGVHYIDSRNKWDCRFKHNKKLHYVGCFETEVEAGLAHDREVIKMGIGRELNFPEREMLLV